VTAYRWYRQGRLPLPTMRAAHLIRVNAPQSSPSGQVVGDARVSSADQRSDLDRQVAGVTAGRSIKACRCPGS
jgi:predicted site-specific integrase-resolvase